MSEFPAFAEPARAGILTDGEIKAALPAATGARRDALLAEQQARREWRATIPEPADLDDDVLAVEALRLWDPDPGQRLERYWECVQEAERRREDEFERQAAMRATRQAVTA